jgi:uncharacterized protein DUF1552
MPRRLQFNVSRRRMLQSLGLGAAASPFIPLLNASAQSAPRPKRLVLLFSPDGAGSLNFNTTIDWKPTGTESDFTFSMIHSPLEPLKSKIIVPWGLAMTAAGAGEQHAFGMAGLWTGTTLPGPNNGVSFDGGNGHLTGWGNAPSIDQLVAQAYGANMPYQRAPSDASQETRYRSIALGVQCGGPNIVSRMTYTGANAPINPETSPKSAFDRYFMGVKAGSGTTEDPAVTRTRSEQKAIIDALKGDLQRIRTQVGAADYQKIDAHVQGVLAMEKRIAPPTSPAVGCTLGTAPASTTNSNANFPTQITQMMDIAAHILACDVTRVLTLQLSCGFSNVTHTWLGHTSPHHTMSHDDTDRRTELQAIDNWYAKQVAYLLQQLDSVNEGSGTLLDNTLVVWGRELGSTSHRMDRVPLIIAGKAGGALRTGRFLNFEKQDHAKLLVSIGQLMGLPMTSIGDIKPNSGPLSGLV